MTNSLMIVKLLIADLMMQDKERSKTWTMSPAPHTSGQCPYALPKAF